MQLVRLTLELLRPVPLVPLAVATEVVRPGRKVQLVGVTVSAAGSDVLRGLVLFVRQAAVDAPFPPPEPPPPRPDSSVTPLSGVAWTAFHSHGVEMRVAAGGMERGPATVWFRLRCPVVAGEEPSGAMRAAAAGDFSNGISAVLPFEEYLFINPDLTMVLNREPVGEWVCLEATTHLGRAGAGMAESALYDDRGRVGRALQTLLVDVR
jgi:hypothetical protein